MFGVIIAPLSSKQKSLLINDQQASYNLAVREGFEPSVQFPVRQFSKLILSASQAPHRILFNMFPVFRDCKYSNSSFPSKKKLSF